MAGLNHLAIIMDGNRRWAKASQLASFEGHYQGYLRVLDLFDWALKEKIKILSLYAFSTENWKRSKREVAYLMTLAKRIFKKNLPEFEAKDIKVLISGLSDKLDKELLEAIKTVQVKTKNNNKLIVNICFNYGGRQEILEAVKRIIKNKVSAGQINEQLFEQYLFQRLPDPDVIVRTSGEQRLSNFLPWQSVYSEFIFLKKPWPAFTYRDLKNIINSYKKRKRRFGGN